MIKPILKVSVPALLAALLLISGCGGLSKEERKEFDYNYKMGVSYLNEGNIQMAFVQLQKAFQSDPKNKDVLNSLGLVYLQLEDFNNAESLFLKAIGRDRNYSDAYNNLGVAYMKKRQWAEAAEAFHKALLNPLYTTPEKAFYNLGMSYYRLGLYTQAADALKDCIRRQSASPHPFFGLSLVYNKEGKYGDSAALMSRAIAISHNGDRMKFMEEAKQRLLTAQEEEAADLRDYLEILNY